MTNSLPMPGDRCETCDQPIRRGAGGRWSHDTRRNESHEPVPADPHSSGVDTS